MEVCYISPGSLGMRQYRDPCEELDRLLLRAKEMRKSVERISAEKGDAPAAGRNKHNSDELYMYLPVLLEAALERLRDVFERSDELLLRHREMTPARIQHSPPLATYNPEWLENVEWLENATGDI